MDVLFKLCAFALVTLVLAVFLQQHSPQTTALLAVAACVAILWVLAPYIRGLLDFCGQLASQAGLDGQLLLPVCKVMGIAVCCRITAEVCRDNGQKALAAQVELGGAVCGLLCALPLLQRALELIGAL